MNILFLGLGKYQSIKDRGIYLDLLRVFIGHGDDVSIVTALPPESKEQFELIEEEHSRILRVKTGKITKTNIIEKGINTILLEGRFIRAIDEHFRNVKFDLVLYPTPPITFLRVVAHIKKRDGAIAYLMLKDIFPQNAVDIGMMSKSGLSGIMYRYFRNKEKKLYSVSDYIGCMSQANVDYVLKHNPEIDPGKVEICPNSVDILDMSVNEEIRVALRKKYGIPLDKKVFIYGGNLGKPQGIPFLIECLKKCSVLEEAFFLIVGDGTEFKRIERFVETSQPQNVRLMKRLPKNDYDNMVGACDVGMIFLDHRFTIPNFPSRLLSYMQARIPVLACTDPNTDIGKVITEGGFGWWCESDDQNVFVQTVNTALRELTIQNPDNEQKYLFEHYSCDHAYQIIVNSIFGDKAK